MAMSGAWRILNNEVALPVRLRKVLFCNSWTCRIASKKLALPLISISVRLLVKKGPKSSGYMTFIQTSSHFSVTLVFCVMWHMRPRTNHQILILSSVQPEGGISAPYRTSLQEIGSRRIYEAHCSSLVTDEETVKFAKENLGRLLC